MRRRSFQLVTSAAVTALVASSLALAQGATAATTPTYKAGTPLVDTVSGTSSNPAPWTLAQGDVPLNGGNLYGGLLPTFTFGAANATVGGNPNYSVYPGQPASNASGAFPYATGFAGDPGPVDGYCSSGGPLPETGSVVNQPAGSILPMAPYYFPEVIRNPNDPRVLTGFFDYRPKDTYEATVVANSFDGGASWRYVDKALANNPGVCAYGIQTDAGQGHPWVTEIGGQWYLYTLNRQSGDTLGQGLLVHKLDFTPTPSARYGDPLAGLAKQETVDLGPNPDGAPNVAVDGTAATTATGAVNVPWYNGSTGGVLANPSGATIKVANASVFNNNGNNGPGLQAYDVGSASSLTDQGTLPAIHCTTGGSGTTLAGCFAFPPSAGDGSLSGPGVTINVGDNIVAAPEVPDTASLTDPASQGLSPSAGPVVGNPGLQAPDGIIGSVPASALPASDGVPAGATVVIYGEKLLSYWAPATLVGKKSVTYTVPTSASGVPGVSIPVSSFGYTGQGDPLTASLVDGLNPASGAVTGQFVIYVGWGLEDSGGNTAPNGIAEIDCTGASVVSGVDELTGCTANSGTSTTGTTTGQVGSVGATQPVGSYTTGLPSSQPSVDLHGGYTVGASNGAAGSGACVATSPALQVSGEGSTNPKTLYKNNEDYTVIRAAYTTDGINFNDLGIVNGINDPAYQGNAGDNTPSGQAGTDLIRYVGSRGSIVPNAEGGWTMFMSGADCQDGDSDSFQQMFTSTTTDGINWSTPVPLITNDLSFAASAQQEDALLLGNDIPLAPSGYYSGRTYDPVVVPGTNGNATLFFSGYRTGKPLPTSGSTVLGNNPSAPYNVGGSDPALYRSILSVHITEHDPGVRNSR